MDSAIQLLNNWGQIVNVSRNRPVDLIHDTRYLCKRLKTDGMKVMSRGFSGDKQKMKSANTRNRARAERFIFLSLYNGKLLWVQVITVH